MLLKEYLRRLEIAIPIMQEQGRDVRHLIPHYNSLKAIFPNKITYIDLHEFFLKEAEEPIYPLYLTQVEVFMMQIVGYVPEKDTDLYKTLLREWKDDFEE